MSDSGGRSAAADGLRERPAELRVLELARREVDAHGQVIALGGQLPGACLATGGLEHPASDGHDGAALLGDGDEVLGHAPLDTGRVPAHERLEAGHGAIRETHDGLVLQAQLLALDRLAQGALERATFGHAPAQGWAEHLDARLAGGLRPVHRGVRLAQQHVRGGLVAAERDADADADADAGVAQQHRLGDGLHHPTGHVLRLVEVGEVLEQHRELVATQPGDGIGAPHAATQAVGDGEQHVVAPNMAELVVDRLEAVDIREQHRHAGRTPLHRAPAHG